MSRVVVEVSQLLKWPGQLTGIPRVMDELSQRFAKDGAIFVDWDVGAGQFYEIDFLAAMQRQEQVNQVTATARAQKLRNAVKAAEINSRLAARGVRVARRGLQYYRRGKATPSTTGYKPQPDDVFLIIWGEAIDEGYTQAVVDLQKANVKVVQFSHDMIPLVTPQFAGHTTEALRRYVDRVFPNCSLILTISQNTKRDVVNWLKAEKLAVPPVEVIRLGDDFDFAKPEEPRDPAFTNSGLKGQDYILAVGTVESRKNHALFYYTYKLAKEHGVELPKLVIVGRRGWKTENVYDFMTEDPEVKDNFVFLHHASDEELSWLYKNCLFSVYVSFYEGWGLPIAESIMRGVPCIASSASSMPEVADGLAAAYVSPNSSDECLAAIQKLAQPKELAAARKKIAGYQPRTWDQTFTQVHKLLEGLNA